MSWPSTATPMTSSVGNSSAARASVQLLMWISDRIDDGVGDHFAVIDALARSELHSFGRMHHHVDVAADVEHRGRVRQLGAEHRVVRLALEALAVGLAHHGAAHHVALVVR